MDICKLADAESIVNKFSEDVNILGNIEEIVRGWPYSEEIQNTKCDIGNLVDKLRNLICDQCNKDVSLALHCIVHNILYDSLMSNIKEMNQEKDNMFFVKLKRLCKLKVSLPQLGSKIDYATHFPATVVELSILNNYKSPLEKLNCLCCTFDFIYAELKTVIASMMSKYSDRDNDIPTINGDEIYPVLMFVIIKSKMPYFYSDLFYIKFFGPDINNDPIKRQILGEFEKAAELLAKLNEEQISEEIDRMESSMDLMQYSCFSDSVTNANHQPNNYLCEHRRNIYQQIDGALSQNLHK